jgi:hypothetical protein
MPSMVVLRNTRLGEAYRDATVQNAFGDRYVYSLCLNPQAREYAVNIVCPGTVGTPVWQRRIAQNQEILMRLAKWYPLGRWSSRPTLPTPSASSRPMRRPPSPASCFPSIAV